MLHGRLLCVNLLASIAAMAAGSESEKPQSHVGDELFRQRYRRSARTRGSNSWRPQTKRDIRSVARLLRCALLLSEFRRRRPYTLQTSRSSFDDEPTSQAVQRILPLRVGADRMLGVAQNLSVIVGIVALNGRHSSLTGCRSCLHRHARSRMTRAIWSGRSAVGRDIFPS